MSFTNSSLVVIRKIHPTKKNGSGNYTRKITKITPHHAGGIINGSNLLDWGHHPSCGASWNYNIGNDGVICQMIDEKDRAWTSSSPANDYEAITVEIGNSMAAPNWEISKNAMESFINLCVDICRRNPGIKQKNGKSGLYYDGTPNGSLTLHRMFAATSCPEKYVISKIQYICDEVNKRLELNNSFVTPTKNQFEVVADEITVFNTAYEAETRYNPRGTYKKGSYYIYNTTTHCTNITREQGKPGGWILNTDNVVKGSPTSDVCQNGSKVCVKRGAKTFTGGTIASFVYDDIWIVEGKPRADGRAVINRNIAGNMAIMTPVNVKDLVTV